MYNTDSTKNQPIIMFHINVQDSNLYVLPQYTAICKWQENDLCSLKISVKWVIREVEKLAALLISGLNFSP